MPACDIGEQPGREHPGAQHGHDHAAAAPAPRRPRIPPVFGLASGRGNRCRGACHACHCTEGDRPGDQRAAYARAARHGKLPQLVAVDEAATEPSPGAARSFLQRLGHPLGYPVALDPAGRLADGYGVRDQPWFVLTSTSGKIMWKHDGWLPVAALKAAAHRTRPATSAG